MFCTARLNLVYNMRILLRLKIFSFLIINFRIGTGEKFENKINFTQLQKCKKSKNNK